MEHLEMGLAKNFKEWILQLSNLVNPESLQNELKDREWIYSEVMGLKILHKSQGLSFSFYESSGLCLVL